VHRKDQQVSASEKLSIDDDDLLGCQAVAVRENSQSLKGIAGILCGAFVFLVFRPE
jgi:RNase P/RNase MRP subunit p29